MGENGMKRRVCQSYSVWLSVIYALWGALSGFAGVSLTAEPVRGPLVFS
jgi:hypothetical protein